MPRKLTELQVTKKHIRTCHDLVDKIEKELADEGTDRSERTRLLTSLAKLNKEIRSLENKKAKLANAKPHGTRLIGFHHLQDVFRADRCLMASYRWNGRTINVAVPDSDNLMSLPRYTAYTASRDAAEKIARSLQGLERQATKAANAPKVGTPEPDSDHVSAETIKNIGSIMGNGSHSVVGAPPGANPAPKKAHICDEGCRLFGCSIQDALQAAARVAAAAMVVDPETEAVIEPVPVEASPSEAVAPLNVAPEADINAVEAASLQTAAPQTAVDAEVLRWINSRSRKQVHITPDADLENQPLQFWIDKATITVRRMVELYHAFSSTLSREASLKFDNHQAQLAPMLGKIIYYEPETVNSILGNDAVILLDNSATPKKPVIDTNTQILTELKWLGKSWAPTPLPRLTGYLGPAGDLDESKK